MDFRNPFARKSPPPAAINPPAPIPLMPAPRYQPVPGNSADPIDAEVARLWNAFQRTANEPTWAGFIASLRQTNGELAERLRQTEQGLGHLAETSVFRP